MKRRERLPGININVKESKRVRKRRSRQSCSKRQERRNIRMLKLKAKM